MNKILFIFLLSTVALSAFLILIPGSSMASPTRGSTAWDFEYLWCESHGQILEFQRMIFSILADLMPKHPTTLVRS
ncbi:MAG: hypothetical protein AB7G93_23580 [Bdellovibrionales bacterium]